MYTRRFFSHSFRKVYILTFPSQTVKNLTFAFSRPSLHTSTKVLEGKKLYDAQSGRERKRCNDFSLIKFCTVNINAYFKQEMTKMHLIPSFHKTASLKNNCKYHFRFLSPFNMEKQLTVLRSRLRVREVCANSNKYFLI